MTTEIVTWDDKRIVGTTSVGALVFIDPLPYGATFEVEWTKHGETGYGKVAGVADSVDEAKAMVKALLEVRRTCRRR